MISAATLSSVQCWNSAREDTALDVVGEAAAKAGE
eukprot:CAMPEP_0177767394 /NCGR_PEP_ID=MMETSP0491_2-20121128/9084_1 /TAXON_ID=63592 /ORGANISM="Tetraselmis chuii, Strain PLY429" /LENGTH=34 /DNA_ID= /DNA_START= /DNA_END= /DNA_ORIENTATION=